MKSSVWRGTLDLLALMVSPAQNRASRVYELMGTRHVLGEESFYLNLGYWDGSKIYDAASARLAEVLGEAAELKAGDELLDCGFGFADQDMFWSERFGVGKITGLNISASQVAEARRRIAAQGRRPDTAGFERLPREFQQYALLRVHLRRFPRRDAEERGVEAADIAERAGGESVAAARFGLARMQIGLARPARLMHRADEIAAFAKRLPKAVTRRAREPESDTDNSQPITVHRSMRAQVACRRSGVPDPRRFGH